MKKNQIILIIIGVLVLIGFVSSFSYWLGQRSVEVKSETLTASPLESKVIQNWKALAVGKVIEMSGSNLTLSSNEESLTIPVSEKADIKSIDVKNQEKSIKEISFEEIKIGNEVNIEIGIDKNGKIWAYSITVLLK